MFEGTHPAAGHRPVQVAEALDPAM
jgi:hypothetical protein